ncbi:MAG: U-box domain-containing protein [Myxococcota bacterium]
MRVTWLTAYILLFSLTAAAQKSPVGPWLSIISNAEIKAQQIEEEAQRRSEMRITLFQSLITVGPTWEQIREKICQIINQIREAYVVYDPESKSLDELKDELAQLQFENQYPSEANEASDEFSLKPRPEQVAPFIPNLIQAGCMQSAPVKEPPSEFELTLMATYPAIICPLSGEIMTNPVVTSDGISYQKNAFEKAQKKGKFQKPVISFPNITLRQMIADLLDGTPGETILQNYHCAISLEPFQYPAVASDGHTYERNEITLWIAQFPFGHAIRSPIQGLPLSARTLINNYSFGQLLKQLKAHYLATISVAENDRSDPIIVYSPE